MPVFYPSCVVNLRVRFDEGFAVVDMPQAEDSTIEDVELEDVKPQAKPIIVKKGKDNLSHILNRVPKRATLEIPNVRQAGTFTLEFDWRELPIDPRLVRAVGVDIFQGAVDPDDFATGMITQRADGRRVSVLNVWDPHEQQREDLLVFSGSADVWKMTHDDRGSYIQLEGRDLRGIFLDSPFDLRLAKDLDLKQPIHEVVQQILNKHPFGAEFETATYLNEWPKQFIPSPLDKDGLTRVRQGADGQGANSSGASSKMSFWDLITQYCTLVGAVPHFIGRTLFIRPGRGIYQQVDQKKLQDTQLVFDSPRYDDLGREFVARKMIYGRNIKEMNFERKLAGGIKVPIIEMRSHDTSGPSRGKSKLLITQFPTKDMLEARYGKVSPSGEVAGLEKIIISKPGIRSIEKLKQLAEDFHEEYARQEMGGSIRTKNIASFGGHSSVGREAGQGRTDADLLRLKTGDAVELLLDIRALSSRSPNVSAYTDTNREDFEAQVQNIMRDLRGKAGGVDENLVRVLLASGRSQIMDLLRYFRVSNVRYNWSNGVVEVAFDFHNYFVVRHGVLEKPGEPKVSQRRSSTKRRRIPKKIPKPRPQPRQLVRAQQNQEAVNRATRTLLNLTGN